MTVSATCNGLRIIIITTIIIIIIIIKNIGWGCLRACADKDVVQKTDEVTDDQRKLHNEKLHDLLYQYYAGN